MTSDGNAVVHVDAELGGAITSFTLRGRPVLRPTPDAAWATHNVRLASCYPLVPYSNRIRDAVLSFDGVDHPLDRNLGTHPHAIHGVGWQRAWTVDRAGRGHAQLSLEHVPAVHGTGAWPWPFRVTHTLELEYNVLTATLTLFNSGTAPFPFGLGWHPFFVTDAGTTVAFRADGVWENDETPLPLRHVDVPAAWPFLDGRPLDGIALDNVFTGWSGRVDISTPSSGVRVTLSADRACAFLVAYAPPLAQFIALEPVTHETDAFNRAARGATGTGFRTLQPAQAFSCTMRVAVSAPA